MQKYQKIRTVGHRECADVFNGPVVIQEKVDGSNFGFGRKHDGTLFCMSRTQDLSLANPDKSFAAPVAHVLAIQAKILPGWLFRAEFLRSAKHNVLAYGRAPLNGLVLFDAEPLTPGGELHPALDERPFLIRKAYEFDMEIVPELFRGEIVPGEAAQYLARESFLGGPVEGIVIKNYNRFTVEGRRIQAVKIVRTDFKEVHEHVKRRERATTPLEEIAQRFATPARWQKALQHLQEQNLLVNAPEDIPGLIREVRQDVEEECIDEIKEALWQKYRKELLSGSTRGLAEWYKSRLGQITCL